MRPLTLVLVRHGVTDWNEEGRLMGRCDIGLNARGRAQAAAAGEALRAVALDAVRCSPTRRALETAAIIARTQELGAQTDPDLDEVWVGRWQGKTFAELQGDPDLEHLLRDPEHLCDAIEPAKEVERRVVAAVERLRAEEKHANVLLVSHGDPLRLLVAHYLSLGTAAYRRLTIATGSVSLLRFDGYGARLLALNWRADGLQPLLAVPP